MRVSTKLLKAISLGSILSLSILTSAAADPATNSYSLGSGLTAPYAITKDSSNNIWFTDSSGIGEIPDGSSTNTTPIQYDLPTGSDVRAIAVDSNGNVWTVDSANPEVYELTGSDISTNPSGSSNTSLATSYATDATTNSNSNIVVDSNGNVWVTIDGNCVVTNSTTTCSRLEELTSTFIAANPSGTSTSINNIPTQLSLSSGGDLSSQVTVDNSGNVWIVQIDSNNGDIINEIPAGTNTAVQFTGVPSGSQIQGITTDNSGNVWFTDNNGGIGEIPAGSSDTTAATMTVVSYLSGMAGGQPSAITTDNSGNVWFTTAGGDCTIINSVTTCSNYYVGELPTGSSTPILYAVSGPLGGITDPASNMWFTQSGANQIEEFDLADSSSGGGGTNSSGTTSGASGSSSKIAPKTPDTGSSLTSAKVTLPLFGSVIAASGMYILSRRVKKFNR